MTIPIITCWIMIHFAKSAMVFYIARLIGGLGLGALCAMVPMYIGEIAEESIRGMHNYLPLYLYYYIDLNKL